MYIALALMFCGVLTGRLMRGFLPAAALSHILFVAVLGLLLLLGLQVGANEPLFASLDKLGLQALVLTLSALAGSILAVLALDKLGARLARHPEKMPDNAR